MTTTPATHRSPRRRSESGASAIRVILSLLLLAGVVHVGWVFIPLYISVYDFNSEVEKEAQFGADKTNEAIVKALISYAAERNLSVRKENLHVERTQSRLTVSADYVVPVKTVFYTHEWQVSTEKSAVLF